MKITKRIGAAFKSAFRMHWPGLGGSTFDYLSAWQNAIWGWLRRYTGTRIDYAKELGDLSQSSLIMSAVNWLARALPEAPVTVYEEKKDGTEEKIIGHALSMLWRRPNPFFSGVLLWMAFALSWVINGNVYFIKVRNSIPGKRGKYWSHFEQKAMSANEVVELWWVPHFWLFPRWPRDGSVFISHYDMVIEGQVVAQFDPQDVLHFRYGIDPNNTRSGLSPVASILREIYTDQEAAAYTAILMRNMGIPGVVISPVDKDTTFADESGKTDWLRQEIKRRFSGDGRGEAMILNAPAKVEFLSLDPRKLNLGELREISETRLCSALGIPPIVLNFKTGQKASTFSNYEQAREQAYEDVVIPTQRVISADMDVQLLPDFDDNPALHTGFDLSKVRALQQDQDKLYLRLSLAYKSGWLKRSEARSSANWPVAPEDEQYAPQPQKTLPGNGNGDVPPQLEEKPPKGLLPAANIKQAGDSDPLAMSAIDQEAIELGRAFWKDTVDADYKDLIDAVLVEE